MTTVLRRVALVLPLMLALLLTGSSPAPADHYSPYNLHWKRTAANGSSSTQTLVYFENHLASYHGPVVARLASSLNSHPYIAIRMVAACPAGSNCVKWYTRDLPYPYVGLAGVSWGNDRHLLTAWVKLDPVAGWPVVWHEGCHAFGGGHHTGHSLCNDVHWLHHWWSLVFVYYPHKE